MSTTTKPKATAFRRLTELAFSHEANVQKAVCRVIGIRRARYFDILAGKAKPTRRHLVLLKNWLEHSGGAISMRQRRELDRLSQAHSREWDSIGKASRAIEDMLIAGELDPQFRAEARAAMVRLDMLDREDRELARKASAKHKAEMKRHYVVNRRAEREHAATRLRWATEDDAAEDRLVGAPS